MRILEARVVAIGAVIVLATAGTVIYSKSDEQTVRSSDVAASAADSEVVVPEPEEAITVAPVEVDTKKSTKRIAVPPAKVADSDSIEPEEMSAIIDMLSVEIDQFLKLRQEARDENPLPELVEWLKLKDEIDEVAVTEASGELVITFKGGGATVLQIGQ